MPSQPSDGDIGWGNLRLGTGNLSPTFSSFISCTALTKAAIRYLSALLFVQSPAAWLEEKFKGDKRPGPSYPSLICALVLLSVK